MKASVLILLLFFTSFVMAQNNIYQDDYIYGRGLSVESEPTNWTNVTNNYLAIDGSNANQNIDISSYNLQATNLIAEVGTESITLTGDHINYESTGGDNNFHFQGDNIAWLGADFYINNFRFTNNIISHSGGTISFSNENLEIDADAKTFCFGASQDGCIEYDNTNLIIDPDVVGTGKVYIGATGDDDLKANHSEFNFLNVTDLSTLDGGIKIDSSGGVAPIDVNYIWNTNDAGAIMSFDQTFTDLYLIGRVLDMSITDSVPSDDATRTYQGAYIDMNLALFLAGTPADTRTYTGYSYVGGSYGTVVGSANFNVNGISLTQGAGLNFGSGTIKQRGISLIGWGGGSGLAEQYAIYSNGGDWVLDHDGATGTMYLGDTQETGVYQTGNDFIINNTAGNVQIGDGTLQKNISLTSPDSTKYNCGVNNGGAFVCV